MQKNSNQKNALGTVKILVFAALMCALSGVFKFIAPTGDTWRISFENFPIIFSGIVLGPYVAAIVGIVSDLLGCLLRGYAINPLITFASMLVGLLSGIVFKLFSKNKQAGIVTAAFSAHIAANALVKTLALHIWYHTPFFLLLGERTVTYLVTAAVESVILVILLKNKAIIQGLKRVIDHEL